MGDVDDMDSSSIGTGCSAVFAAIANASPALRLFIREVREARPDVDAILAELHSLERVVDILQDDASSFPLDLTRRTPPLLEHCTTIVEQVAGYMHVCNGLALSKRDKKFRWLAIRADVEKLRATLEGYKAVLAVVTDLVGLNIARRDNDAISVHSDASDYKDIVQHRSATNDDIRTELAHVVAHMGSLRGRLQGDFRANYAAADLESYLDALQLHAENLAFRMNARSRRGIAPHPLALAPAIAGKSVGRGSRVASSVSDSSFGDQPDSAIDVTDGPPSPDQPSPTEDGHFAHDGQSRASRVGLSLPIIQLDDLLQEISADHDQWSRAPTPPPKAPARGTNPGAVTTARGTTLAVCDVARPTSVRSVSQYSVMINDADSTTAPRRVMSTRSLAEAVAEAEDDHHAYGRAITFPNDTFAVMPYSDAAPELTTHEGKIKIRPSTGLFHLDNSFRMPGWSSWSRTSGGAAARASWHSRSMSLLDFPSGPAAGLPVHSRSTSDPNAPFDTPSARNSVYLMEGTPLESLPWLPSHLAHARKGSADTSPSVATTDSGGSKSRNSGSIRSNHSSRLSSVFTKIASWKPHKSKEEPPTAAPKPDNVFGVSLKKSMQVASATVRTLHDGSTSASRRDFPRCILACVSFIKANNGVTAPGIFAGGLVSTLDAAAAATDTAAPHHHRRPDPHCVALLQEAFSTPPHYGAGTGTIDWARVGVHDAAALIALFLRHLPQPLVGAAVARRWAVLAREARAAGGVGVGLSSPDAGGLDFWDEALLGVRAPARAVFKLLLSLWADVADAAVNNGMTAERLAAALLGPLLHLPPDEHAADYVMGLAFLIRKRGEYAVLMRQTGTPWRYFEMCAAGN